MTGAAARSRPDEGSWWKVMCEGGAAVRDAPSRNARILETMPQHCPLQVSGVIEEEVAHGMDSVDDRGNTWIRLADGELRHLQQAAEAAYLLAYDADGEWVKRLPTEALVDCSWVEGGAEALFDAELAPVPRSVASSAKAQEYLEQLNARRERAERMEAAHKAFMSEMLEEEVKIRSAADPTAEVMRIMADAGRARDEQDLPPIARKAREAERAKAAAAAAEAAEAQATATYEAAAGPPRPPGLPARFDDEED